MIFKMTNVLVVDYRAREWCKLPYPNHPKGCPNYGRKLTCPPRASLIEDYLDVNKEMWMIAVEFNLAEHMERMRLSHPSWSDRQLRCVLYWQPSVNKKLKIACRMFGWEHPDIIPTLCPEAMGVNVIKTAQNLGLPIKPLPEDIVYKIAIGGHIKL